MIMFKICTSRNCQQLVILLCCIISVQSWLNEGYQFVKSYFTECCDDYSLLKNTTGLQKVLQNKLFGQHLVVKAVVNHVRAHIEKKHPSKALALSFHGGTGTGKNYVSKIIADHLYRLGMRSKYVHLISASRDFPHEELVHYYKDQLRSWIETNVSKCSRSLFIFDEMDKMPTGLLDTIKPYLEYYEHIAGIDYRNVIFLFLSNTAAADIFNFTYTKWTEGVPRDQFKLKEIEDIIIKSAFNFKTQKGFWQSELITQQLITAYIPFLSLEKSHVIDCVKTAMVVQGHYTDTDRHNIPGTLIQEILDEMPFFPDHEPIFSIYGCKRVMDKVDYVMLQ